MKKVEKKSKSKGIFINIIRLSMGTSLLLSVMNACSSGSSASESKLMLERMDVATNQDKDSLKKDSIEAVMRNSASQPVSSGIAKDINLNTKTPKDKKLI